MEQSGSDGTSLEDDERPLQLARRWPGFELLARLWNPNEELKVEVETFDLPQLRCVRMLGICWRMKVLVILINLLITFILAFALEDWANFWLAFLWLLVPPADLYTWYRWAMNGVITGSIYYFYLCFAGASVHLLLVSVWALGFMFGSFGWTELFAYGGSGWFSALLIVLDAILVSTYTGILAYTLFVIYSYMRRISVPLGEVIPEA